MSCVQIADGRGGSARACLRGSRASVTRCSSCRCAADLLCDGPPRTAAANTCDAPICANCAEEIRPDRHLCRACQAAKPGRTADLVDQVLGSPEPDVAEALAAVRGLAVLTAIERALGPCWHCKGALRLSLAGEHAVCAGGPKSRFTLGSFVAGPCGFRYWL